MPQTRYKISEARKNFAEVLERANQGEEIIIMRGNDVYARIGPGDAGSKRPFGLLRQRDLPDDLFDDHDADQADIDAGDGRRLSTGSIAIRGTGSWRHRQDLSTAR